MTPERDEFRSVDWEGLSEKRNWGDTVWTAAAILIILAGFVGGMMFRTSLTPGPEVTEDPTQVEQPAPSTDRYTGS